MTSKLPNIMMQMMQARRLKESDPWTAFYTMYHKGHIYGKNILTI
jgi:hypothetical protein